MSTPFSRVSLQLRPECRLILHLLLGFSLAKDPEARVLLVRSLAPAVPLIEQIGVVVSLGDPSADLIEDLVGLVPFIMSRFANTL